MGKPINDSFFVYVHFQRTLADGRITRGYQKEPLTVNHLLSRFHYADRKRYGTLFFNDGSQTAEFAINENNPSYLARTAMNYERWLRGRQFHLHIPNYSDSKSSV